MFVVKKVDVQANEVTLFGDGVLNTVPLDRFLVTPGLEDVVSIQQSTEGEPMYVTVTPAGVTSTAVKSDKSKIVAALLAFFLGGIGIHNFYLGKTGRGIAQLIIGTLGWFLLLGWIAPLWAFIEMICILVSHEGSSWHQDGQGRELRD